MTNAARIERAKAVRIEGIIEQRGVKLRGKIERTGPCPICGGTDRFAINVKKQLWNCRGCSVGGDVIALVQHLDGVSFVEACATLAGEPVKPNGRDRGAAPKKIVAATFEYHDESGGVPMPKAKRKAEADSPAMASRLAVTDDFVREVYESFKLNGAAALESVRLSDPKAYLSFVSDLVPRMQQIEATIGMADEVSRMSEDELRSYIAPTEGELVALLANDLDMAERVLRKAHKLAASKADPEVVIIGDMEPRPKLVDRVRRAP